ncbi:MAG: glycosyltransferase family 39 protein, partial [Candidatus Omnitrophica bacterium]|nr:glycosyltransferase family 39 protein [Candidatus Omnitrophota bacterium]
MDIDNPKKAISPFLIILTLFLIGFGLRLYHLGTFSLCDDEIVTVLKLKSSFFSTLGGLRSAQFPPLHYVILYGWTSLLGHSEWALRFPSALFSALTVIVIYQLGYEFFNKEVGVVSALLLAFSPFALDYGQNVKMYALFWLLTAGAFLFLFLFIKTQEKRDLSLYVGTSILSCYTMYTGFLFLLGHTIIYLLFGTRERAIYSRRCSISQEA